MVSLPLCSLKDAEDSFVIASGSGESEGRLVHAGLKRPSLSESESSRREGSAEGPGNFEAPPKPDRRAASASEASELLRGPVPLQSRPNPERRLREQQFAQEAQSTQLLHRATGALDSASKAFTQRDLYNELHAEPDDIDPTEQPGAALRRYLSTSQQVASALAASRAQLPELGSPALPSHLEQVPKQEQCIQELRDRVSTRALSYSAPLTGGMWPCPKSWQVRVDSARRVLSKHTCIRDPLWTLHGMVMRKDPLS